VPLEGGRELALSEDERHLYVVQDTVLSEWAVAENMKPTLVAETSGNYTSVVATQQGYIAVGESGFMHVGGESKYATNAVLPGARRARISPLNDLVMVPLFDAGRVVAFEPNSGSLKPALDISDGLLNPTDLVFSADGNRLYIADLCGHSVHVFQRNGESGWLPVSVVRDEASEPGCLGSSSSDGFATSAKFIRNPVAITRLDDGNIIVGWASLRFELERYRDTGATLESVDDFFNGEIRLGAVHIDALLGGGYRGFSPVLDDPDVLNTVALSTGGGKLFATSGMASAVGVFDGVRATAFLQQGQGGVTDLAGSYTLRVSADAKHVYVGPRNHDTVGIFATTARGGLRHLPAPRLPVLDQEELSDGTDLEGEDGAVAHVALFGEGERYLAAAESRRQELHVLERNTEQGTLVWRDGQPLPQCAGQPAFPADVFATPDGAYLLVADFQVKGSACIHSWAVEAGGALGPVSTLEDPILDGIETFASTRDGQHVYAACFGSSAVVHLTDNAAGAGLAIADFAKSDDRYYGIEIMALSPDENHLYVTSPPMNSLFSFARDATGALSEIQALSDAAAPLVGAAGIVVSTDGSQVFVASREDNGIAVFDRDSDTGKLSYNTLVTHPSLSWPNGLALNPDGDVLFVASTGSNALTSFRLTTSGPACP
jgi:6-phosphogluconolactonase (cycloisomerase 2 family)